MKVSWNIMAKSRLHAMTARYTYSNHTHFSTVAVALWAMEPDVTVSPIMQLTLDAVYDGGIGNVMTDNPKWLQVGRD
jgi:hypothetical protein